MTVSATTASNGPYTGNGATTSFPFTFEAMAANEIEVLVDDVALLSSAYTVTLNAGGNGGTVAIGTAPASGAEVLVTSSPSFTQEIGFSNSGPFLPESHEEALDRAAVRDIYLKDKVDKATAELASRAVLERGLSAYDVAVANGFVGTEGEWVLTLAGGLIRNPPVGFPAESIPFDLKVYEEGTSGVFAVSEGYAPLTPAEVALTIYVDGSAGLDANPGTNPMLPKKSLKSAETKIFTDGVASALILAKGGFYNFGDGFSGQVFGNCTKFGISSWDGSLIYSTTRRMGLVWTAIGGGAYSTPLTSVFGNVRVWAGTDVAALTILSQQASIAAVQANASSFYHDGTTLYVQNAAGTSPDASTWVLDGTPQLGIGGPGKTYRIDNIEFIGGGGVGFGNGIFDLTDPQINNWSNAKAYRMVQRYSSIGDSFGGTGAYETLLIECGTYDSEADGFTYGAGIAGGPSPRVAEVNCTARRNGRNAAGSNQCSTGHAASVIVTVNPDYDFAQDRTVHDVDTARRWVLGGRLGPPTKTGSINVPVYSGATAAIWIDKVNVAGAAYGIATDINATVYNSGSTITGTQAGNVVAYTATNVLGFPLDILASIAEYLANAAGKVLSVNAAWGALQPVALTPSATVTPDLSAGINFTLAMGGDYTLANPANVKPGQTGFIQITQDGTGSRTLAYGANWKFAGGTDPALSLAAGAVDILTYQAVSATTIVGTLAKAVA